MSYDKNINNYTVKFKDEISYLEAKLEKLKLYPDIPFIGFIQNEMYDKSKCEVESIEPTQYMGSGSIDFNTSTFTSTSPMGFALGGGDQIVAVGGNGGAVLFSGGVGGSYTDPSGDFHITGNLVVDGTIEVAGNASFATGGLPGAPTTAISEISAIPPDPELQKESPKEEPPIDPINSRFDILDL